MKICVTSQGLDLESQVDPRFGRAAMFLLVDTDTGKFEVIDNKQNLQAAQGAGIQTAQNVAETGAKAILTGHCGPKAFSVLTAAGIEIFVGVTGSVEQAIEAWKSGKLEKASNADVEAHW